MTTDSLEPIEPTEGGAAASDPAPAPSTDTAAAQAAEENAAPTIHRRRWFARHDSRTSSPPKAARHRLAGFAAAFIVGTAAALVLVAAVALAFSSGAYGNRVLPGVHVGSVDLSGLTHDEAVAKLQSEFAYLGEGEVTVTTPVGVTTIPYQQLDRKPDVEAMADAAMAIGRSGNPPVNAISTIHSVAVGQTLPVVIRVDSTALAQRIHQLVGTSSIAARDAQVTASAGIFNFTPSATGQGVDEMAVQTAIIDQLTQTTAPVDLQVGGSFTTLKPRVSDEDARNAIARAEKMIVDVSLTWSTPPAGASSSWTAKNWAITASQIRGWIVFGARSDGTYGPTLDPAQTGAYLSTITASSGIAPVEPVVIWDDSGKPVDLTPGKDGVGVDLPATIAALTAHLDARASGGSAGPSVEVTTGPIRTQIAGVDSIAGMVDIGHWTTTFFPGDSNGYGANIRTPAKVLNGQVIGPGQQFSFLKAVGPIDPEHGFTVGGVIVGGQSDHTGAMGGGICSASTTMFNAAANAGIQIDERHPHYYYIDRYPIGRDATVYSNGITTWDLLWTNDTTHPIVIRAWTTPGSRSTITIQLWSWPTNRTVAWTGGGKADIVPAGENPPRYVSTLNPGATYRAEYAVDGFKTGVARVVTDSSGAIIHSDAWGSSYSAVNGQLLIGGAPPSTPGPTPTPGGPTPTPTPVATTPTPSPTPPAPRRRRPI